MILKSVKKVETNVHELEVSISPEDFEAAIVKVFNKQKKRIAVPGFRKGKATRNMIERFYGENVFYEDALEEIYPKTVSDAIEEAKLETVDAPHDVEIKEIGKNGVELTFKVTVKPEVELGDYKGIEAVKLDVSVSDADVDAEIERLRERNSRIITVEDRAAQNGDIVVIDFDGYVDGVAFDGGKAENHSLTLGSGQFIPGFEEQVCGHNVNDEFDVNVTFPEDYGAAELAGKAAVFKIKLHEIKIKELPEVDDDFAKDVGEDYETVDDLKAGVKKELEEAKQANADRDFESKVLEKLADLVKAEIPEVMFKNRAEDNLNNFAQRIGQQGIDVDTYLHYMGVTRERLESDMYDQAKVQVKIQLALDKIIELEKIEATDEDIEAEYKKLADTYNMDVDKVKKLVDAKALSADVIHEKAAKFVVDNAKPLDKEPEAPAKKPAAKKTAAKKAGEAGDGEEKKPAAKKAAAKKPAAKKAASKKETAAEAGEESAE